MPKSASSTLVVEIILIAMVLPSEVTASPGCEHPDARKAAMESVVPPTTAHSRGKPKVLLPDRCTFRSASPPSTAAAPGGSTAAGSTSWGSPTSERISRSQPGHRRFSTSYPSFKALCQSLAKTSPRGSSEDCCCSSKGAPPAQSTVAAKSAWCTRRSVGERGASRCQARSFASVLVRARTVWPLGARASMMRIASSPALPLTA
mmetsp:Transcript_16939/g.52035  ORF Transcript_16939/g.52035 Transcript_16939/m.52035 type:complete len:204 (+) Transcript_16939:590-1201(+)